jgi:hypothetical protein
MDLSKIITRFDRGSGVLARVQQLIESIQFYTVVIHFDPEKFANVSKTEEIMIVRTALLLLLAGSFAGISAAPCATATIQTYAAEFGTSSTDCSLGLLTYNNFSFTGLPSGASLTLMASTLPNAFPGFNYTLTGSTGNPFQASTDTTLSIIYEFTITSQQTEEPSLTIESPTGSDTISEVFCLDSNPTPGFASCLQGGSSIPTQAMTVTSSDPSGSITFSPPAEDFGWVETVFTLDPADAQPGSFDAVLSGVVVPEPVSAGMMGLGLLALGAAGLRGRHYR